MATRVGGVHPRPAYPTNSSGPRATYTRGMTSWHVSSTLRASASPYRRVGRATGLTAAHSPASISQVTCIKSDVVLGISRIFHDFASHCSPEGVEQGHAASKLLPRRHQALRAFLTKGRKGEKGLYVRLPSRRKRNPITKSPPLLLSSLTEQIRLYWLRNETAACVIQSLCV